MYTTIQNIRLLFSTGLNQVWMPCHHPKLCGKVWCTDYWGLKIYQVRNLCGIHPKDKARNVNKVSFTSLQLTGLKSNFGWKLLCVLLPLIFEDRWKQFHTKEIDGGNGFGLFWPNRMTSQSVLCYHIVSFILLFVNTNYVRKRELCRGIGHTQRKIR